MAYNISRSDLTKPVIIIDDNNIGSTPALSIPLVGRSYVGYGDVVAESLVHLLENFANSSPPTHPIPGQLWFDNNAKRLRVNVGDADGDSPAVWKEVSTTGDPSDPIDDLYVTNIHITGDIGDPGNPASTIYSRIIYVDEIFPLNNSNVSISGLKYPNTDGTNEQVLSTDGNGNLYWSDKANLNLNDYANLNNNEIITGSWTYTNEIYNFTHDRIEIQLDVPDCHTGESSKRVTVNDGGGDLVIRAGIYNDNKISGGTTNNERYCITGNGGCKIALNEEIQDGSIKWEVAKSGTAGAVATTYSVVLDSTGTPTLYSDVPVEAPSFNTTSALKYKKDVSFLSDALEKVLQIDTIYYKLKNDYSDKKRIGVTAESMARVVPELVEFKNGEPDAVNYAQGFALLVQAIKEQEERRLSYKIKLILEKIKNWWLK